MLLLLLYHVITGTFEISFSSSQCVECKNLGRERGDCSRKRIPCVLIDSFLKMSINQALLTFFFVGILVALASAGTLRAGAAKVNGTLPIGVPLAGYNHGARLITLLQTKLTSFLSFSISELKPHHTYILIHKLMNMKACRFVASPLPKSIHHVDGA